MEDFFQPDSKCWCLKCNIVMEKTHGGIWLRTEQRAKDWGAQKEPNSSPKLGKKILMASQAHGRKPQKSPNICPRTAGLGSSSCRLHGPQQKVRSFMGSGPKLPNVLVPGGEVPPRATSMENAECWIQSQQLLLLSQVPKPPLLKQPPLGRSRCKVTPLKQ